MTERSRAKAGARKRAPKTPQTETKTKTKTDEAPNPFAELSFEAALAQLEGIVDRLEEGDLDLADALTGFEEGVQLTRHCQGRLEAAEQRVELLTREGAEWSTRPFDASATGESDAEADAE